MRNGTKLKENENLEDLDAWIPRDVLRYSVVARRSFIVMLMIFSRGGVFALTIRNPM
jgi:hypothetical protein